MAKKSDTTRKSDMAGTTYTTSVEATFDLPEHLANPFTARLGVPLDLAAKMALMSREPSYDAKERKLPPHLRRYCVMRLFEFVHPRACQFILVDRIGMLIRNGYKDRNPASGQHLACILDAADRREAKKADLPSVRGIGSRATGLALLGQPGMGKSLSVNLALQAYPTLIVHTSPNYIVQVPWIKIECPSRGGNKQFCIAFFDALGARVGQNYRELYGSGSRAADDMMLDVQQLCQVHAVGILIIDELQHAAANKEGPTPLMNFLVTLTNIVGVPVMLVGTMGATPIIEQDFRSARRAAGLGQPTWIRLQKGEEWDDLVKELWKFQWTAEETAYSDKISEALYHESQGIIDILVKLVMLSQFRAISIGEVGMGSELLTPELIADVAKDELRVVRPMMNALRDGREDVIEKYHDLVEFHHHVDAVISRDLEMTMKDYRRKRELTGRTKELEKVRPDDALAPIRAILATRGMPDDLVEATLEQAIRREPSGDLLAIIRIVSELVEGRLPPTGKKKRRAGSKAAGPRPPVNEAAMDPDDLRRIAREAKGRGASVHTGLVEAGVSKSVAGLTAA